MTPKRDSRRLALVAAGALVWLAAAALVVWTLAAGGEGRGAPLGRTLAFAVAETRTVAAELPRGRLAPGDRVLRLEGARLRPCGEVLSVSGPVGGKTVRLALYPDAGLPDPLPPGTGLLLLDARGTLEWALARVLSPERRARLRARLQGMVTENEAPLREAFGPVLEEFTRGVVTDVVGELSAFARTNDERLREVGEELLERAGERWEPLLRELLWPRLLEKLEPLATRVGEELWSSLPWGDLASAVARSYGSRLANIFVPDDYTLPTDQFVRWRDDYVRNKAIPTIERHLPEALALASEAVREVSTDPRVEAALRATVMQDGLGDPRVLGLIAEAFSVAVIDNPRLRARLMAVLDDPRMRRVLFDLAERLEPRLIALGRAVLLDDEGERLHPELAMLVRVRLIGSETTWVLLELPDPDAPGGPPETTAPLEIRVFSGSRTQTWERPL